MWYSTAQAGLRFVPPFAPRTLRNYAVKARSDAARVREVKRRGAFIYEMSDMYLREIAGEVGRDYDTSAKAGRKPVRARSVSAPDPETATTNDTELLAEKDGRIRDLQEALRHEQGSHERTQRLHAGTLPELVKWRERAEEAERELHQAREINGLHSPSLAQRFPLTAEATANGMQAAPEPDDATPPKPVKSSWWQFGRK